MSNSKPGSETHRNARVELSGKILRRREQQVGAADPRDSSRSFAGIRPPVEVFRRRREEDEAARGPEPEKRLKFEIVDDTRPHVSSGGYNPYDASK